MVFGNVRLVGAIWCASPFRCGASEVNRTFRRLRGPAGDCHRYANSLAGLLAGFSVRHLRRHCFSLWQRLWSRRTHRQWRSARRVGLAAARKTISESLAATVAGAVARGWLRDVPVSALAGHRHLRGDYLYRPACRLTGIESLFRARPPHQPRAHTSRRNRRLVLIRRFPQ
jgi:hypothetical protein